MAGVWDDEAVAGVWDCRVVKGRQMGLQGCRWRRPGAVGLYQMYETAGLGQMYGTAGW